MVERSPEKAGVGGSTPSLATMFSITERVSFPLSASVCFQMASRIYSPRPRRCIWPAGSTLSALTFGLPVLAAAVATERAFTCVAVIRVIRQHVSAEMQIQIELVILVTEDRDPLQIP